MAAAGNRGKYAEGKVRDWLKARSEADAGFAFLRYPDARAGSAQPAPSDFEVTHRGINWKIEVKEVKITAVTSRRLPAANFAADKVARMRKWHLAGSHGWVIVCHFDPDKPRGPKEWRMVDGEFFFEGLRPASWDLTHIEPYDNVDRLLAEFFFK